MSTPSQPSQAQVEQKRGGFSSRNVFIFAAIGSAVGLGNIWRFPMEAYENGGGAFMLPYVIALLTAGIPFLLLDYVMGHRTRGSAPLAFARTHRKTEWLGWWQVGICFVIAVYYAAILAWALRYTIFSFGKDWGDDPETFFGVDFLQASPPADGITTDFVAGLLIPLVIVWAVVLVVMALGVQKGVGATSVIFIPVLIVAFLLLVLRSLFLPGAVDGLEALFTPDWGALGDTSVWAAAYAQIFFSLSIGFGIMITYSSYVGRKVDMTGSGLVVGFANSSFELLCGIGVFSALGFMAQAQGLAISDVAAGGPGLAFVAFPAIINEAPAGVLIGLLFFASLILAGVTSLISILEVVIAAIRDKFELSRIAATMAVCVPAAAISLLFFSTTSALHVLDIVDNFINKFGILFVAVVSMVVLVWIVRALPDFVGHLEGHGSIRIRGWWPALVAVITPLALAFVLISDFRETLDTKYGLPDTDYPDWMVNTFGWGVVAAVIVLGVLASLVKWRPETPMDVPEAVEEEAR